MSADRRPTCLFAALAAAAAAGAPGALRAATPEFSTPTMPAAYASGGATSEPLDHWWRLFGDPRLDALETQAFSQSPDARTYAARLDEASATRRARTAATLPTGGVTGGASRQTAYDLGAAANDLNPTSGVTTVENGGFNVSWELDLFGRLRIARRVAGAELDAARFDVLASRDSLAAQVADAYFQAKGLGISRDDARADVDDLAAEAADARRRVEAGAAPRTRLAAAEATLAAGQARAADAAGAFDAAKRTLMALVGESLADADAFELGADLPAPAPAPAALPADLLARRPDLREAEANFRSAVGAARLAHLAVYPTITLLPALGASRTSAPGVSYIPPTTLATTTQTTGQGFWTLAASVNIPVLDIPRLLAEAKADDARAREAALAWEKAVQTAYAEAQGGYDRVAAGRSSDAALSAAELRARAEADDARSLYAGGLSDHESEIEAQRAWRQAREAAASGRVETLRREVALFKALGGGFADDPAGPGGR